MSKVIIDPGKESSQRANGLILTKGPGYLVILLRQGNLYTLKMLLREHGIDSSEFPDLRITSARWNREKGMVEACFDWSTE